MNNLVKSSRFAGLRRAGLLHLVWVCLLVVLGGCDKQKLYHAYLALPAEGWTKQDTLFFPVEVKDSLLDCDVSIEVRHRNSYPYSNLSLRLDCLLPDSNTLFADTIYLPLADERGVWRGSGIGALYQLEHATKRSFRAEQSGIYLFRMTSLLPDTLLRGINDLGIELHARRRYAGK